MEIITANTEIRCKIPMPQDKNKSKSILLSILKKLSQNLCDKKCLKGKKKLNDISLPPSFNVRSQMHRYVIRFRSDIEKLLFFYISGTCRTRCEWIQGKLSHRHF